MKIRELHRYLDKYPFRKVFKQLKNITNKSINN